MVGIIQGAFFAMDEKLRIADLTIDINEAGSDLLKILADENIKNSLEWLQVLANAIEAEKGNLLKDKTVKELNIQLLE